MTYLEQAIEDFKPVIDKYKELIADGKLDTNDIFKLLVVGVGGVVRFMSGYMDLTFEQRKEIGLALVEQFFNEIIKPIDLPGVPNLIEPYVDELAKTLVMTGVEKLYDALAQFYDIKSELPKN